MRPGSEDIKLNILISGKELSELKRHSWQMVEAFGLDRRIEKYQGKRPIGLYSWDFDCIFAVIDNVLNDKQEYSDKADPGYRALQNLLNRLMVEYRKFE